jgi:hypothetical protein
MPKDATVEVRVADLPQMQQFIGAVADLIRMLAACRDLPDPVMTAADQVRRAVAALGGKDIGAPPASDEDRIRAAMHIAREHPGRMVTVDPDA